MREGRGIIRIQSWRLFSELNHADFLVAFEIEAHIKDNHIAKSLET